MEIYNDNNIPCTKLMLNYTVETSDSDRIMLNTKESLNALKFS